MMNDELPVFRFIIHRSSFIVFLVLVVVTFWEIIPHSASACPFCLAIEPTLAQRRDVASAVALAEAAGPAANGKSESFQLHSVFKGSDELRRTRLIEAGPPTAKPGTLAILFGNSEERAKNERALDWNAVFANEALLGYFSEAPDLRQPAEKRLPFFLRYLEHADKDIARDAYLEFAHASYDDVLSIADQFDYASLRKWLQSPSVPDERKGFYAVSLGMARDRENRALNRALLKSLIERDRGDFRAGLDGIMAGHLLLGDREGLKFIESRYLANEKARHGDIRHAASALRFYFQYGPKDLRPAVAAAMARLVERPAFAAASITDLARWQHWDVLDRVAALYDRPEFADGPTRRAIVGYLSVCRDPRAAAALDRLRSRHPKEIEAAEKLLLLPAAK